MSISYLKIHKGGKRFGTLEIHSNYYPDGNVSFGWEWYGGPEGTDGGPADWVTDGAFVHLELTSPNTGMTGVLRSSKWYQGPVPPSHPWFTNHPNNIFYPGPDHYLWYKSPKINRTSLAWEKI